MDDWQAFSRNLHAHVKMIAVVAPRGRSGFPASLPELEWLAQGLWSQRHLRCQLRRELTVQSYLRHIEENHPPTVVAQPCPAIVTYIELYRQDLLPYLRRQAAPCAT